MSETRARNIRPGEALALDPSALRAGREAFFWLWSNPCPRNERVGTDGSIAVVHVRGPLDHHDEGYGDSYDAIRERVRDAISGSDIRKEREMRARYGEEQDGDEEPVDPPKAVILRIDSPGGVVAGLNACVRDVRKMLRGAGMPACAFVDEMATSAAYALACACDEIYLPPSGIAGSVGVISTMVDQTSLDKKLGLRFVTLTSGARKADGHPHVAISDAAVTAEQGRVDELAAQFFAIVSKARGLSPAKISSYQAGIFLGDDAVKARLADSVMGWDEVVAAADEEPAERLVPSPKAERGKAPKEKPMSQLAIRNLITKTKSAISTSKDADEKKKLRAELASYEATLSALDAKKTSVIEHKERHTDDSGGEDEDEADEDEEEESAEGNETDRGDDPEGDEDDDEDGDEESEEEEAMYDESEEEASAADVIRSAVAHVKDPKERRKLEGQLKAISGKAALYDKHGARLAKLEKDARAQRKSVLIKEALVAQKITRAEAKQLASEPMGHVKFFIKMRPKALVHSTQEDLAVPPNGRGALTPGSEAAKHGLTDEEFKAIKRAHASSPAIPVDTFVANYLEQRKALNGAGGAGSY